MYYLQYLFLLLLGLLMPPSISESDNKMLLNCTSPAELPCVGDSFDIRYPFWSPNRSEYCGHPGFNLTCTGDDGENSRLMITLGGKEYQVNYIDYTNQLVKVTEPNFIVSSCPQSFTNTTLNLTLVNYTATLDLNLTLYLNCSPGFPFDPTLYNNITCHASDSGYYSYYRIPNNEPSPPLDPWGLCSSIVLVPMYQIHANILVSNPNGFLDALQDGFGLTWTVGIGRCGECEESGGVCGYNSSTPDAPTCFCPKATSASGSCVDGINDNWKKIIIGSSVGLVGFLLACLLFVLYRHRERTEFHKSIILWRKNVNNNQNIEAFLEKYGSLAPKRYVYSDLKKITKSFCDKLGQGGFGTVYKGTLSDGRAVAVKVLSDSKGNGEEFLNEVASIGRTSHVNIVSLLGFCFEGSKRALIYDFMCNGSLEKLVYSEKQKTTHDWEKLYQIAIGIARGLEYLHRGCNTRIVHFDIKPHNILLDQDFCPKISDFGLAKLCHQKESIISMTGTRGTIGYIAPEVFSRNFGFVSSKSDVYSYGMMVLEMAAGRKNANAAVENSSEIYFPHWIYEHLDQNGDLQACGVTAENEEIARKMIVVGLWCIQTMPSNRPSISRVIEMLEGSINDLQVPPKPYLSSPYGSLMGTSSTHDGCWNDCSSLVHS